MHREEKTSENEHQVKHQQQPAHDKTRRMPHGTISTAPVHGPRRPVARSGLFLRTMPLRPFRDECE